MNGIYFIGGVSGAGKTTVAQALGARRSMPVLVLDDLQRLLMPALPDLSRRIPVMRTLTEQLLDQLLLANSQCIVDGAWIEPRTAIQLRNRFTMSFQPVYCGYAGTNVQARYHAIRAQGTHWITQLPETQARAFIEKQIRDSETLRSVCGELDLPYFDFSDVSAGSAAMQEHFLSWIG